MQRSILNLALVLLLAAHSSASARDAYAAWDNICEECHGEADEFATKYLWVVDDKLQGRHHIDDLHLFLQHHYIPAHELEKISTMLKSHSNDMSRYGNSCASCHGEAEAFTRQSIDTWGDEPSGVKSEIPVTEFLKSHQGLTEAEAEFFARLIDRVISQIPRQ